MRQKRWSINRSLRFDGLGYRNATRSWELKKRETVLAVSFSLCL